VRTSRENKPGASKKKKKDKLQSLTSLIRSRFCHQAVQISWGGLNAERREPRWMYSVSTVV